MNMKKVFILFYSALLFTTCMQNTKTETGIADTPASGAGEDTSLRSAIPGPIPNT